MNNRNVMILIGTQILSMTGSTLVSFLGGILGPELAPKPSLSTLPITLMIIGIAISTLPASFVMKRIGRRSGFRLASAMAVVASLGAAWAVVSGNFWLFCAASALIGSNNAFIQQYRFAAAESVPQERVSRAVSWVLLGGVAGGILGPEIARQSKDLFTVGEYAGSFIAAAGVYMLVLLLLVFLDDSRLQEDIHVGEERPLRRILVEPGFVLAVLAGVVGSGVMSLIMTATPVSMHHVDHHSLAATSLVIQSHIVAMFLPSLVTGAIIARLGVHRVMALGVLILLTCVIINLVGHQVVNYWSALTLLGLGWNFLFVSGTVQLTRSYLPAERFKAQALNDFSIFGTQALASLGAGVLIFERSWSILNALTIPVLLLMLTAIYLAGRQPSLQQSQALIEP